jgi:hypothetical protein
LKRNLAALISEEIRSDEFNLGGLNDRQAAASWKLGRERKTEQKPVSRWPKFV